MEPLGIIWAGLQVQDLEAQVAFYRDVIGLPLRRKLADWAAFDAGGEALFELFPGGKSSVAPKSADQQSLVIGFRVENLDQTVEKLRQAGVEFIGAAEQFKNSKWIVFADPEGNRLELKEVS